MKFQDSLIHHFRLTPRQTGALQKVGIATVRDLVYYFPSRYEEFVGEKNIADLKTGERSAVFCRVVKIGSRKTWKNKISRAEAIVKDETGLARAVWFNQPYIARLLQPETAIRLTGQVRQGKAGIYFANPLFEIAPENRIQLSHKELMPGTLWPIYPETRGITSRWVGQRIKKILQEVAAPEETIPEKILGRLHLPRVKTALRAIHFPANRAEAEAARKRFAFEEIFLIQLSRLRERKKLDKSPSCLMSPDASLLDDFAKSLPFRLTAAQTRAISEIFEDFKKPKPMARLLEGDVGSGKTVVAAAAALACAKSGYQAAFLAPTEILARQHFEEISKQLKVFRISTGLLTSAEAKKFPSKVNQSSSTHISKNQLFKWVLGGEVKILIGTHALIEERVRFKKLGFVVVDEQHRFGTEQRRRMLRKNRDGPIPHFLSMTATPIPRTLALTIYGDLDISVIDEMPTGRKTIETRIVQPRERQKIYEFIRGTIAKGAQAFVVCPRIEANCKRETENIGAGQFPAGVSQRLWDWDDVKSVKKEYKKLTEEIFPEFKIGMIHGKMSSKEKEAVMVSFRKKEFDMLVSTSVIEVGVDVPNASIMVIEGGERFGLSTLHQFRGRVGRGGQNAYCFVFTTENDLAGLKRLRALEEAKSGFELAEYDLLYRGPGELAGKKQWGLSDIGMEALKNMKMVEAARTEAKLIIAESPDINDYPLLKTRLETMPAIHFE